jgi:hypothetical protein
VRAGVTVDHRCQDGLQGTDIRRLDQVVIEARRSGFVSISLLPPAGKGESSQMGANPESDSTRFELASKTQIGTASSER